MKRIKEEIIARTSADLDAIEIQLKANLDPWLEMTKTIAGHILFAGGKRLRPLLMVLASRACGYSGDYDTRFAVLFEYLHAATLLHDDLVDDARIRRGTQVANLVYGNAQAVLTGDFLLARSLSLAAKTRNPAIIAIIAKVTEDMSQGEIFQLNNRGRLDISQEEYMAVIYRKTASLIQGAVTSGALLAGANEETVNAFADYGYHLGIAFQMADDLLDYTSDLTLLGKEPGADLKEGKLTMPVIYALTEASGADYATMKTILASGEVLPETVKTFQALLEKYGGIAYTEKTAQTHVAAAKASIDLPGLDPKSVRTLKLIADYALERKQ